MADAYHYVRFRWWSIVDLERVSKELSQKYEVKMHLRPSGEFEINLFKDERDELIVKSDTLMARLSPFRAVLTQKKPAPFTPKDIELRKKIIELYPRNRMTPFPWMFSYEPKFEITEEK